MNRLLRNCRSKVDRKTATLLKIALFNVIVLVLVLSANTAFAETSPTVLANRLASRLGGFLPQATITNMATHIQNGDFIGAAQLATASTTYGDSFLFNLVAPMCTLANSTNVPSNPCIATLQYIAWNNKPWTDALDGTYVAEFTFPSGVTGATAAPTNNNHWQAATTAYLAGQMSYVSNMTTVPQTTLNPLATDPMGVMTVYQAAFDAANMGTNRRFVEILMQNFLGVTLDSIRDSSFGVMGSAPEMRIRQDVNALAPDAATFSNTCATCHGGIDGMAAAFNFTDYTTNNTTNTSQLTTLASTSKVIVAKLVQREQLHVGSPGFIESKNTPELNSWVINYKNSPYGTFAWGATSGVGANELGQSAAATDEFRINIINRIWQMACGEAVPSSEIPTVVGLANYMRTTAQDQVTPMVWQVATLPECLGR